MSICVYVYVYMRICVYVYMLYMCICVYDVYVYIVYCILYMVYGICICVYVCVSMWQFSRSQSHLAPLKAARMDLGPFRATQVLQVCSGQAATAGSIRLHLDPPGASQTQLRPIQDCLGVFGCLCGRSELSGVTWVMRGRRRSPETRLCHQRKTLQIPVQTSDLHAKSRFLSFTNNWALGRPFCSNFLCSLHTHTLGPCDSATGVRRRLRKHVRKPCVSLEGSGK